MEINMQLSSYFSEEEWKNLSDYDKLRYKNILENYTKMCEVGLMPAKPDFMKRQENCGMKLRSKRLKIYSEKFIPPPELSIALESPISQVTNGHNEATSVANTVTEVKENKIRWKPVEDKSLLQTNKKQEKESEELENEGAKSRSEQGRRYPRRAIPFKNYTEDDVPNDDDYIFCDECEKEWEGDCPIHGPLIPVEDNKVPPNPNDPTRAERTLPSMLVIAQSAIPNAGKGVWTKEPLMKGIRFGPYEGTISDVSNNNGYCWQISCNRRPLYSIDAYPKGTSNWMRYVNCARHVDEQNLIAFQYKGKIYYRTLCDIAAHVELLVWYGEEFGRELGIDLADFQNPQHKYLKDAVFACSICAASFPSPVFPQQHIMNIRPKKKCVIYNQNCNYNENKKSIVANNSNLSNSEVMNYKKVSSPAAEENKNHLVEYTSSLVTNCIAHKSSTCKHSNSAETSLFHMSVTQQRKICITEKRSMCHVHRSLDKTASQIKTKLYSADVFGYQWHDTGSLKRYKRKHSGEKPYSCDICGHEAGSITVHKETHIGEKPYSCNICNYKCSEAGHPIMHKKICTGEEPYSYEICGYNCNETGQLTIHTKKIPTGEECSSCDICGYRCSRAGVLSKHKRIHTGEKPYSCDICGYKCRQAGNLKLHKRIHTGEKPYSCDICGYKCSQAGHLKSHKRIHTGEKPYSCDICDYKCSRAGDLTAHKRIHTGEKPYSCDICGYKCSWAGYLTAHKRIHTGEKPYSCDICDYKCSQAGNLTAHKRIHTGEKPYSCDICGYKCSQAGHLTTHKRIHTGEKPYSCDICGYKCSGARDLTRHKRIHTRKKTILV